jgi:cyclopropane-fatty-acyl-phospholipid synthase
MFDIIHQCIGVRHDVGGKYEVNRNLPASVQRKIELDFVRELKSLPIAIKQESANEQHYEVTSDFYNIVLGPKLKYSSGLWEKPTSTFEESEV